MTANARTRIDWGDNPDWTGNDDREPAVMLRADGLSGTLRLALGGDDPTEARSYLADHLLAGAQGISQYLTPGEESPLSATADVLSSLGHALRDLVKGEDW